MPRPIPKPTPVAPDIQVAQAGFTLVEMLVSLVLFGLAALLMLQGLGSVQRLWAGEAARATRGDTVASAQALLRARIERLRPNTRFEAQTLFADVDGAQRRLVFVATPADAQRPGAARRYRLTLNDRDQLVLGAAPPQVDAEAGAVYADQVLLDDVEGLDISYYGPDSSGAAPRWRSDWTGRATAPDLIRVKLNLRAADRRVWPDLIIHPAATFDTLCTIDPTAGRCRGRE